MMKNTAKKGAKITPFFSIKKGVNFRAKITKKMPFFDTRKNVFKNSVPGLRTPAELLEFRKLNAKNGRFYAVF